MNDVSTDIKFADEETSSDNYASRFSGSVGDMFKNKQTKILSDLFKKIGCETILDVAGGHGQTVAAISSGNYKLTILGSTEKCNLQIKNVLNQGKCSFKVGNIEKLDFPDKTFDVVVCLRYLCHTENWPAVIEELCRVAKKAVIVDFPPLRSFNLLNPFFFKLKRKVEGNTRPFIIFKHSVIEKQFALQNFKLLSSHEQFFFPMVLHRAIGIPIISEILEFLPGITGLTRMCGSPVIQAYIQQI